jgi:segregation and condensation protein B
MSELERVLEALLFLSSEPVGVAALADAAESGEDEVRAALERLGAAYDEGDRGLVLREVAGGFTLATDPIAEHAARRLLARPRTPPLSAAQAETLAIVAYLQPVSRPEITRIRGVAADSAAGTLLERGLIEESGRSQFGAVLYRTTDLFLRLFGLRSLDDLPDPAQWDPTPEETADLRDRLLRAGDARAAGAAPPVGPGAPGADGPEGGEGAEGGGVAAGANGASPVQDPEGGTEGPESPVAPDEPSQPPA